MLWSPTDWREAMKSRRIAAATACLVVAACAGEAAESTTTEIATTTTSTSTTPTSTVPDLRDDLQGAEETIEELEAQVDALEGQLSASEQATTEAETARDAALAELEELRLAYDDEIQQIIQSGVDSIVASTCSAIDEPLDDSQVSNLIDRQIGEWSEQPGLPENAADALDRSAIETQVSDCVAAAEEAARQAELTDPKGDGFYTVGEEIAPGTWESQGSGDGCYWARLDAGQELIDNHFGNAGGRITIRSSDTEVEFSDCGTWEFQG